MKKLLLIIIFFCGLGLCCYPTVNRVTNHIEVNQSIKQFKVMLHKIRENELKGNKDSSDTNLSQLFLEFQNYNEELYDSKQVNLADPFSYEQASFNLKRYGFEDNMVGYVIISTSTTSYVNVSQKFVI